MNQTPLDDICRKDIQSWRDRMLAQGMNPSTVKTRLEGLVTFFNEAKRDGYVDSNPALNVNVRDSSQRKKKKNSRRPFLKSEMFRLIDASGPCLLGAEITALNTGGRNGDVTEIRLGNIDGDKAAVDYFNRKGGRDMETPLLPEYFAFLEEFLKHHPTPDDPSSFAFWLYGGKEDRVQVLDNEFARVLIVAGLRDPNTPKPEGSGRRSFPLVFHSLRWALNLACYLSKMPGIVIQELVGHKDQKTSEGYTDIGFEEKQTALYKAAGKEHLLKRMKHKREPYMDVNNIAEVTAYATKRLRELRQKRLKPRAE